MTDCNLTQVESAGVAALRELGKVRIASEAAAFRLQALALRIEHLATAQGSNDEREAESADAVMADDGGPLTAV